MTELDAVYEERNRVVAAFASLALHLGWSVGIARPDIAGWDKAWLNCVFIDTPMGQASWHYHDRDQHLFDHFPAYHGIWDGHTTEDKHGRLKTMSRLFTALHDSMRQHDDPARGGEPNDGDTRAPRHRLRSLIDTVRADRTQRTWDEVCTTAECEFFSGRFSEPPSMTAILLAREAEHLLEENARLHGPVAVRKMVHSSDTPDDAAADLDERARYRRSGRQ